MSKLVGSKVAGWNPLLTSLISLAEELEKLGLVYNNGTVILIEQVEVSHV